MLVSEFDYELPGELIAQEPLAERDRSRMLMVDCANRSWRDSSFAEFPEFLKAGRPSCVKQHPRLPRAP